MGGFKRDEVLNFYLSQVVEMDRSDGITCYQSHLNESMKHFANCFIQTIMVPQRRGGEK